MRLNDEVEVDLEFGKAIKSQKDAHSHVKKYAKISFWRNETQKKEQVASELTYRELTKRSHDQTMNFMSMTSTNFPQDQLACSTEIRVNNPLTLDRSNSALQMKDFVFLSDDSLKMFYFSTTVSGQDVFYNQVDLHDLSVKTMKVRGTVIKILIDFFSTQTQQLPSPTLIGGGTILCLAELKNDMFSESQKKVPHLHFFNLKWEVQLEIKEATCLLKNLDQTGSKVFESIWYLKKNKLIQAEWPSSPHEPSKIMQMFDLIGFKQNKVEKKEVEGYIHSNNTRCTIIVKNQNWYTFALNITSGLCHPAHQIVLHDAMKDAVIIKDYRFPQSLKIAGHITSMMRDSHHNVKSGEDNEKAVVDQYTMVLIDLNESEEKSARFMNATNHQKLQFKLTPEFKNVEVPMRMMSFTILTNNVYSSQLFYKDLVTGGNNVFFIKAELRSRSRRFSIHSSRFSHLHPWMMPKMMHIVQYPILAYTTSDPKQNEIMICNLSKNIPQKKLRLDFKVICFCTSGPQHSDLNPNQIEVYFLAQNNQAQMNLYKLTVSPWVSIQEEYNLTRIEMNVDFGKHPFDQIKKAQLLLVRYQDDVKNAIVVQMPDKILLLQEDDRGEPVDISESENEYYEMAPMNLMSGIWERCYFVRRSQSDGDELMCIKYCEQTDKIHSKIMYKQKEKILQLQINHDAHPKKINSNLFLNGGQILILDQSYTLRLLEYENQKKQTAEVSLFVSQQWSLADYSIKRVLRALDLIPWSNCVLSVDSIQCGRVQLTDHKRLKKQIHRNSYIYSINGQTYHPLPFFECYDYNEASSPQCREIHQIKGIGKTLSVIKENDLSFFLTSQSPCLNRVDFMSYVQQNYFETDIYVLKKLVIVAMKSHYLAFCQETLMLIQIGEGLVKPIENAGGEDELIIKNDNLICIFEDNGTLTEHYDINHISTARNKYLLQAINHNITTSDDLDSSLSLQRYEEEFIQKSFYQGKPVLTLQLKAVGLSDPKKLDDNENLSNLELSIIEANRDDYCEQKLVEGKPVTNKKQQGDDDIRLYYINFGNTRLPLKDTRIVLTDNHFVIYIKRYIWFIKRDQIRFYFNDESVVLKDYAISKIMSIDLNILFEGPLTYSEGFRVQFVKFDDLLIMDNAWKDKHKNFRQTQRDAIQISFTDIAIIWDLDQDQQISVLEQLQDFANVDSYVRTGYNYFRSKKGSKSHFTMNDVAFLMTNSNDTLVSAPLTENRLSECFRNYSQLELQQLQFIQNYQDKNGIKQLQAHHINLKLLNVNINGETFFTRFYKQAKVLDLAYRLVVERGFEREEDDEYDNVFIRRMFYTMCLPFDCDEKDETLNQPKVNKIAECYRQSQNCWKNMIRPLKNHWNKNRKKDLLTDRHLTEDGMKDLKLQMNKHNLCQWMIQYDRPEFEKVLRLMLMSSEMNLRTLIQNFRHFKSLFNIQHDVIGKFLEKAFIQTPMAKRVTHISFNDAKMLVFTGKTSEYSPEKIKLEAEASAEKQSDFFSRIKEKLSSCLYTKKIQYRPCLVRIIEVKWLNLNIPKFYKYLATLETERAGIFDNEFIKVLLQEQNYTWEIFRKIFLPYIMYMTLLLIYFLWYVPGYETPNGFFDMEYVTQTIIRCIATLLSLFLFYEELKQIVFLRMAYWSDVWNYCNIGSLVINQYIVFEHSTRFSQIYEPHLIRMTSLASIMLALMLFYWMRLIPSMAFYVKMLTETIKDLQQFVFFYFMIICTFACAQVILESYNKKRMEQTDEDYLNLIKRQTALPFFDAWVNQYLLGLGDFYYLPFKNNNDMSLEWLFFVLSTFLTQIVFLNMLIAIMGDTFDRLTEKKTRNGLIQTTQLYSDFINNLKTSEELDNGRFLYMVTPIQDEEANDSIEEWEGGYNRIKEALGAMEARQADATRKRAKKEETLLRTIEQSLINMNDNQRRIMQSMESNRTKYTTEPVHNERDDLDDRPTLQTLEKTTLDKDRGLNKVRSIKVEGLKPSTILVSSSRLRSEESESDTSVELEIEKIHRPVISVAPQSPSEMRQLKLMITNMNRQITERLDKLQAQGNKQEQTIKIIQSEVKSLFVNSKSKRIRKQQSEDPPTTVPNEFSLKPSPSQNQLRLENFSPISSPRRKSPSPRRGDSHRRVSVLSPLIIPLTPTSDLI